MNWARYFPWIVVLFGAGYLFAVGMPPRDAEGAANIAAFARLPVVDRGRIKPFDTVARNTLMAVSSRQTFTDDKGDTQPAIRWMLDVMANLGDGPAKNYKVFRIDNEQLLNLLGLKERPGSFRYSLDELLPKFEQLVKENDRIMRLDAKKRDLFDNKILELGQHLQLYQQLADLSVPLAVPPESGSEDWTSIHDAIRKYAHDREASSAEMPAYLAMLQARRAGDTTQFNQALGRYQDKLAERMPDQLRLANLEVQFNHFAPFYQCALLYVVVFALTLASLLGWSEPLNRGAFWLAVLTFGVHTWALLMRMYLQGRPPVTNLYSSAVFIGWGCALLGIILQILYRNGIGNLVTSVAGALTLVIAHNLASGGDTLEMMQAVLDTNFWLATHVTCITFGYTATFVAGILGIVYVVRGVFTQSLNRAAVMTLGQMTYGILCFATFLSFTGTVLGGIWADQSWGRFWGWDPKENGALLIVIWNALILHARWGGMVKQRGVAVLTIFGNIVTAWSWFGVNMLSVGLHTYGFMSGAVFWLVLFIFSQLALIVIGLLPLQKWHSHAILKPRMA